MPAAIERIFLDWSRPALPAAAAVLADRFGDGETLRLDRQILVLPGGRAGRRLLELLLQEAENRDARLLPPRIVTAGTVPELLFEPAHPIADPGLTRLAWATALRRIPADDLHILFPDPPSPDDLRAWLRLAGKVEALHRETGAEGLTFADVAERCRQGLLFDDGDRWRVLAGAQSTYRDMLADQGRTDNESARAAALEAGTVQTEAGIWLLGVAELPGLTRRMLEALHSPVHALVHAPEDRADAFEPDGCIRVDAWRDAGIAVDDARLHVADRPAEQAEAVVRRLAATTQSNATDRTDQTHAADRTYQTYAADQITVGVPDREVVPFVEERLASAGAPVRDAAGEPLDRSPPYRLLSACADYLDGRRFDAFAALIRHPDLWRRFRVADAGKRSRRTHEGEASRRTHQEDRRLESSDAYFSTHLPATLAGALPGASRDRDDVQSTRVALEDRAFLGRLRGTKRLAEWMPEILELLVAVYGDEPLDRDDPGDRRLLVAAEALHAAAARFHLLPQALDETCDAATAIGVVLDEVRGEAVAPEPDRAAIELLGWLELHLDDAPVLVVTGFNDGHLPQSVSADVFLPDALRTRLGLQNNERRLARDAYLLTAILASRAEVTLVAGRRDTGGDPLRPSRLMLAVRGAALAERVRRFYGDRPEPAPDPMHHADRTSAPADVASPAPSPDPPSGFTLPPEPVLHAPEPLTSLYVTDFRRLLADPYLFALERILRLEPLNDAARELDGAAFGSLAHDVLQRFGKAPELHATDARAIAQRLNELLDAAAAERFGRHPLPAVRVQLEQLRVRLRGFAAWHAGRVRDGWRVVATEMAPEGGVLFDVDGEPVRLRGRIDRIDHHAESGAWAVLDYKTSEKAQDPDAVHRAGRGENRRWVDLQLPLYRHLLAAIPDAAAPADAMDRVQLGFVNLSRQDDRIAEAMASWTPDELAEADEMAREVVRYVRDNAFRFDETLAAGYRGPFAALLGQGHLVAAIEDDADAETDPAGAGPPGRAPAPRPPKVEAKA